MWPRLASLCLATSARHALRRSFTLSTLARSDAREGSAVMRATRYRMTAQEIFWASLIQMVLSHLICPRSNPKRLTAQAVAVALTSLNSHPEKWDQPPAVLIGESFKAAFPCGG